MQADARLERGSRVLTPQSAPSLEPDPELGPDPEEDARARAKFAALHGPALRASGVPERYWGRLLHKLEHEVRAGVTRGGRRAGRGEPGCRARPERPGIPLRGASEAGMRVLEARILQSWSARARGAPGVGRSGPFYQEGCGLRAGSWPRAAGVGRPRASWRTRAEEVGRAPGGVGGWEKESERVPGRGGLR